MAKEDFRISPKAKGMRTHFYEYCFFRAVEMAPQWSGMEPLTTTQARTVRSRVRDAMRENATEDLTPRFFRAVDTALAEHYGENYRPMFAKIYNPDPGATFRDSSAWNNLNATFRGYLGYRNERRPDGSRNPGAAITGPARIPISPYDRRFSMRETVLAEGAELLAVPAYALGDSLNIHSEEDSAQANLAALAGAPDYVNAASGPVTEGVQTRLTQAPDLVRNQPDGQGYCRKVGTTFTDGDTIGLAALKPYMTEAEYRQAVPHMRAGLMARGSNVVDPTKTMSSAALARSVAVLDYLSDQGVDFQVVPDLRPGQLKARITGENIDIRLTDTRENEAWVGRVYQSGVTYTYSRGGNGRTAQDRSPVTPTAQQTVDLVRFARGEEVLRSDGSVIGRQDGRVRNGKRTTYHVGSTSTFMTYVDDNLYMRMNADARSAGAKFYNPDQDNTVQVAENDLRNYIDDARSSFSDQVDIAALVRDFVEHHGDEDFEPDYDGHVEVARLREQYWGQLQGSDEVLLAPGVTSHQWQQAVDAGDTQAQAAMELSDATSISDEAYAAADSIIEIIDGAENIDRVMVARLCEHRNRSIETIIGTFEPDAEGKRFDPIAVATYMNAADRSSDNLDGVKAALRGARFDASELKGESFAHDRVADALIYFDTDSAVSMSQHEDQFVRQMYDTLDDAISRRGGELINAVIDEHGIVQWEANSFTGQTPGKGQKVVRGELGQIFTPGEHGEVITDYGSGENFMFVPGYEATVMRRTAERDGSMESRTRLRGYEHVVRDAIVRAVGDSFAEGRTHVGTPTNINAAVRHTYAYRHPVDYLERSLEEGMSVEDRNALLATEALRVRYSNELGAGATTLPVMRRKARTRSEEEFAKALRNDNSRDPLALTDGRNISVLDAEQGAGYFDPIITGTGTNQGLVRYLVPSAQVGADGFITPGDSDDRVPLAKLEITQEMQYDPHDRQNMTFSNLLQSTSVVPNARVAMMQCGGWTFEDGVVISKAFADQHSARGADGELRSLTVGDKLSDTHGDKGVIALVVDPSMSPREAEEAGLTEQVQLFQDNPSLDIVMSPFSPISRFNAGTSREMMKDARDIIVRDNDGNKRTITGASGSLNIIVTHMSVDKKTSIYDAEAVNEGKGRKASSQQAWMLQAKDCPETMKHLYGANTAGLANTREYFIALGMDLSPEGIVLNEYASEDIETRSVFDMPDVEEAGTERNSREAFNRQIGQRGGFMEIPFPLELANGKQTPQAREGVYLLPVLSAHLRQEQDLGDGSVSRHDHTRSYLGIHDAVYKYLKDVHDGKKPAEELASMRTKMQNTAQSHYNTIAGDIEARRIEGKNNIFRQGIMSKRQPHSATSVISPDPRLGIGQVAMNSHMAAELGVDVTKARESVGDNEDTKDRYVLDWRDPVLRDGAGRYLEVVIDERLACMAINPLATKSMDGDFDGDTVGSMGKFPEKVHDELMGKFTVAQNLLDHGVTISDENGNLMHPLGLHDSLDIKVAMNNDPQRSGMLDDIVVKLNEVYRDTEISAEEKTDIYNAYAQDLNELFTECFNDRDNRIVLQFDTLENHFESVASIYKSGAKGSEKKFAEYKEYFAGLDDKTRQEKYEGSQLATSYKAQLTGVAGAVAQSQVQAFRTLGDMKLATELTYPVTQAMLQAKHDPVDARYRAETLDGPVRQLWQGRKLERGVDQETGRYTWSPVYDEDGEPIQATREEFVTQFEQMFTGDTGMGVDINTDYVERAADLLEGPDGKMLNMQRDNWDKLPTGHKPLLLDRLAYNATLDDLIQAAEHNESLFEGLNNEFAPLPVRRNIERMEEDLRAAEHGETQVSQPEVIAARDVAEDYTPKPKRVEAPVRKKHVFVPPVEQKEAVVEHEDAGMEL